MENSPKGVYGSSDKLWQQQSANIPESVKAIRGIYNLKDSNANPEDENNSLAELGNRFARNETTFVEQITSAEDPHELFDGLREYLTLPEDGNVPNSLAEHWTSPRLLSAMHFRERELQKPVSELLESGYLTTYDKNTGEGTPKRNRHGGYAIAVYEKQVKENGYRYTVPIYYFGKEPMEGQKDERLELSEAYKKAIHEFEARAIIGEHIGVRVNVNLRDNLEELTALLHSGRLSFFKADHLKQIFNAPSVKELKKNPDNHVFGDQVEEALFLNLIMLNSPTKERMKKFLGKPGTQFLIAKMAKEKEDRINLKNNAEGKTLVRYGAKDWEKEYIGNVDAWDEDQKRHLFSTKINNTEVSATWKQEAVDGRRGLLTQWGNIAAFGGDYPGEFSKEMEDKFIEKIVGDAVDSVEASWLAATLMRSIGVYATEGYVDGLPKGEPYKASSGSYLPLGEGRYITGDDTGKLYAYMFNLKEGMKGRASGLKDMIGKIPDMACNLFDWARVTLEGEKDPYDITGRKDKIRSIWDAWLGTEGGIRKIDLVTGKPIDGINPKTKKPYTDLEKFTVEEGYHRLGDLNFASMEREFHAQFSIMQWLIGNREGPTGVLIDALKTDFSPEEFYLNELKKKIKYAGIVMNQIILTKGSEHLYENIDTKKVYMNFIKNLILARKNSASYKLNILNKSIPIFNQGTGAVIEEVPLGNLLELFVEEALKDVPKTEAELLQHYIDENIEFIELAKLQGNQKARIKVVEDAKSSFSKDSGIIRGR